MEGDSLPSPLRDAFQHFPDRHVHHGSDVARHRLGEVRFVEGPHEQDRLPDPGLADGQGLRQLHHREAGDRVQGLEQARHVGDSKPVAVVLDDGEDGPRRHPPGHLVHVVAQVRRGDLDPGIEGRIGDGGRPDR